MNAVEHFRIWLGQLPLAALLQLQYRRLLVLQMIQGRWGQDEVALEITKRLNSFIDDEVQFRYYHDLTAA